MACEFPLEAWRLGARGRVHFKHPKNGLQYTPIKIPCGQCILCRIKRAQEWAMRITHEAQNHEYNSFITLTYDEEHLPEDNSLNYRGDMQPFWKRLRKEIGELRYFAVGEYGDATQRPHYHACVFGHAFTAHRLILREEPSRLWTNQLLMDAWGKGHVSVGTLNYQTAAYTASYVTKKLNGEKRYVRIDPITGELVAIEQPRAYMSLNPAIGKTWIEKYGKQVYAHDRVVVNGRPQKPPKYYDAWLGKTDQRRLEQIKDNRRKKAKNETAEQTHARARNAHARAKSKSGSV